MLEPQKIQEIEDRLENLPEEIYQAELKMIENRALVDRDKYLLEAEQSVVISNSDAPNATEKKAQALIETKGRKENLINSTMKYEKAKAYLTLLNNEFTSLRKISSVEIELMKNDGTNI